MRVFSIRNVLRGIHLQNSKEDWGFYNANQELKSKDNAEIDPSCHPEGRAKRVAEGSFR